VFEDIRAASLIGSATLAVIRFERRPKTCPPTFRVALWPALALATAGVAITVGIVVVISLVVLGWATARKTARSSYPAKDRPCFGRS
jgi:potassium/hydrogen antiporter